MPTYEYECDKCGKRFDIFQGMADESIKKCPECGGKFHRLISGGSGIIFKGSGFYETDYKKKSKKEDSKTPPCPAVSGAAASDACKNCPAKREKSD